MAVLGGLPYIDAFWAGSVGDRPGEIPARVVRGCTTFTIWTRHRPDRDEPHELPRFSINGADNDCTAPRSANPDAWRPSPASSRDFIASPKNNLYRSLHTTVIGPTPSHRAADPNRGDGPRRRPGIAAGFSSSAGSRRTTARKAATVAARPPPVWITLSGCGTCVAGRPARSTRCASSSRCAAPRARDNCVGGHPAPCHGPAQLRSTWPALGPDIGDRCIAAP